MKRGTKLSIEPKESQICVKFYNQVMALKQFNFFAKQFLVFHIPNEQKTNVSYTLHLKKMGLLAGVPDYCCIGEDGAICFIEFKRNNKCKLTKQQKMFQDHCAVFKIPYFIAYSVDNGINFLTDIFG